MAAGVLTCICYLFKLRHGSTWMRWEKVYLLWSQLYKAKIILNGIVLKVRNSNVILLSLPISSVQPVSQLSAESACPPISCPSLRLVASVVEGVGVTNVKQAGLTSVSLWRSCPGCFFAKSRITSGVLKASLMAAWIAWDNKKSEWIIVM